MRLILSAYVKPMYLKCNESLFRHPPRKCHGCCVAGRYLETRCRQGRQHNPCVKVPQARHSWASRTSCGACRPPGWTPGAPPGRSRSVLPRRLRSAAHSPASDPCTPPIRVLVSTKRSALGKGGRALDGKGWPEATLNSHMCCAFLSEHRHCQDGLAEVTPSFRFKLPVAGPYTRGRSQPARSFFSPGEGRLYERQQSPKTPEVYLWKMLRLWQ